MEKRSIKLNTGADMPLVGYGTFQSKKGEIGAALKVALDIGYRHIDCAPAYDNQKEIGQTLQEVFAEGRIKREDLFITSKLRAGGMNPEGIANQLNETLTDLQTPYLDLYLIHMPVPVRKEETRFVPDRRFGLQDVWRGMEVLYETGKVKAIGVSNYPTVLVNDLLNYAKIKPAVNQIERTPYLSQPEHVKFCRENGIEITGYGALGAPATTSKVNTHIKPVLENEVVIKIAQKHHNTPAQVLLRWQVQEGVVMIPKSVSPQRIKENFDLWGFVLDDEDMAALNGLNINLRYFKQDWHGVPTFT